MEFRKLFLIFTTLIIASTVSTVSVAQETPVTDLKAELVRLKQAYDSEIAAMTARINDLEKKNAVKEATLPQEPVAQSGASNSATAFNPKIGIIFNGGYSRFSNSTGHYATEGSPLSGVSDPGPRGFAVGETEFSFSANVNDLFHAQAAVSLDAADGSVSLEEGFLETLALPAGATVKAGRFFSAIGYLNEQHAHKDNFVDRPMPYLAFLGGQYGDDGVQISFVMPTDLYMQVGAGAFRGASFPAGGADNKGVGAFTGFLRLGGDVGFSNSWRFGLSFLHANSSHRVTGDITDPQADVLNFTGNTDLQIADFKYQWSPYGNTVDRSFVLQGEYLRRSRNGTFNDIPFDGTDTGFYVEGVYKFMHGWRAGYRYSALNPNDAVPVSLRGKLLGDAGINPNNHSFMIDWARNEFSLLRVQFSTEQSQFNRDNRIYLRYIMSIGAHGAHSF